MNSWIDHYNRPVSLEEQQLYRHWLNLSQLESPNQLVERFRLLFVEGSGYPEPEIEAAIERILSSDSGSAEFKFILNRCCYILINRWLMHPRLQGAIPSLVDVFEAASGASGRSSQRLREHVRLFTRTDQYQTLRRLTDMLRQDTEGMTQSRPLGSYIRRYPYLYEHCLLAEDSIDDQRRTVRRIQVQAQRQFEVDLSQYITHRIVRSQPSDDSSIIKNPTLLSDHDLRLALNQFLCKVDGQHTQRDLAQHFLTYSRHTPSYRVFKDELFDYLSTAIASDYGKRQFYDRLYTQLQTTLPENDDQRPNEFLLLRTCSRLLNFLVVESPQQPSHFVFLDLITNIGTTFAVNLLLKIALLCQKVKPHLEKRFSILFNHYEAHTKESGIGWLIEALETLNVAFATNFGSVNFYSFS